MTRREQQFEDDGKRWSEKELKGDAARHHPADDDRTPQPGPPGTAAVQWLNPQLTIGIVRVFPAGLKFGDPYAWCATIRVIRPGVAEMLGVMAAPRLDYIRAIRKALNAEGITLIIFERHYCGQPIELHHAA